MPLDAQSDVPAPPRGFTLDTASPSLPPAQIDDGIPTVTVRPQGAKKPNAGNEGGEPTPPAGFKLDSQPHVEGATPSPQSHGAVSGFSVLAPPPDKAPIVEEAAKRYGVPLNVAHFVGSTESHWNDAATGIPTSSGRASGAWQFMPETAKQYGLANPNDFPTATAAAMHKLADLAANNGGDWEKAVAQYGTFSTGQGADKDAAVRQSFRDYMGDKTPIAQDVAQGTGRGLIQGSGYVLGMPADLWHMMDRGYQWALTKGAEKLGLMSPEEGEELRQPVGGEDGETSELSSEHINKHLLRLAQMGGADISKPVTGAGQAAENVSSFLPGAAAFGAGSAGQVPGALLKYGLIPGATSEGAGQLTEGTAAEPYARVAGAMLPQAVGLGYSEAVRAFDPMNKAWKALTPSQRADAQALLDQSRAAGAAPLTVPEAVQQVTGSGTRLGDMQRVVEQSPRGAEVMRPFFAERPGQTETLATNTLDQIAGVPSDPYQVAPRVQGAATAAVNATPEAANLRAVTSDLGPQMTAEEAGNVIRPNIQNIYDRREGMRNALADQDYGAARAADYGATGAPADPVRVQTVIAHIDDQLTSAKGGVATALRRARSTMFSNGQPDMSIAGLSNARNAITDQISEASRAGRRTTARALQDVLGQLDYALEQVPAYGQARRNFATASEPLRPFAQGTIPGQIIDRDQFGHAYTMPTEHVPLALERSGATGIDQFLAAAENSPEARRAFGQYYSQKLLQSATDRGGRINPDVLGNALRQSADILRRFPEIETQLNRVSVARTALAQVESTPLGALAASQGTTGAEQLAAQRAILFNPTTPLPGSERIIGQTVRAVARHDPEAAAQFVRAHLETAFNEATQNNLPGSNQFGGPKFAAVVAGNSQQAANLEAAVRALPDGDVRWNALRRGLDILQGMGKRHPVGSQTEFNRQINEALRRGTILPEIATTIAAPSTWLHIAKDVYRDVVYGRNTAKLARVFTEGNVADLRGLAQSGARSFAGQARLIGALANVAGQQPTQQPP